MSKHLYQIFSRFSKKPDTACVHNTDVKNDFVCFFPPFFPKAQHQHRNTAVHHVWRLGCHPSPGLQRGEPADVSTPIHSQRNKLVNTQVKAIENPQNTEYEGTVCLVRRKIGSQNRMVQECLQPEKLSRCVLNPIHYAKQHCSIWDDTDLSRLLHHTISALQ